jgi:hypothetical protein
VARRRARVIEARPEDVRRTHVTEQVSEEARQLGHIVGSFYMGVVREGVPGEDATVITTEYIRIISPGGSDSYPGGRS